MKNPTKAVKTARDRLHFSLMGTDRQHARMKEGRVESRPEDYDHKVSALDRHRLMVRKAIEAKMDARELERMTGAVW